MRQGVRPVTSLLHPFYAAGQPGQCGLTGLLARHRRDLLLGAVLILLTVGIGGGPFIGVYFLLLAAEHIAGAQNAFVQAVTVLVTIPVVGVCILAGCGALFLGGSLLLETGEEIAEDWRTRPRRPARG